MSSSEIDAMMNGSWEPAPDGVTANYDSPPNMTVGTYIIVSIGLAITTVLVLLRAYAKIVCLKDVRLPDVLALVAFALYCGFVWSIYDTCQTAGYLVDIWNYRFKDATEFLYPSFITTILYPLVLLFLKNAILLEWARIFVPTGTRNYFWWIAHLVSVFNALFFVAMFFTWTFSCSPVEKFWKPWIPGTQVKMDQLDLVMSGVNLATDLVILYLPHQVIWKLKLPTQKRLGVSFIFATGVIAVAMAAARLPWTYWMWTSNNLTRDWCIVNLWGTGEMTFGFAVFCMPVSAVATARLRLSTVFTTIRTWLSSLSSKADKSEPHTGSSTPEWELKNSPYRRINPPNAVNRPQAGSDGNLASSPHNDEQSPPANNSSTILRTVHLTQDYDERTDGEHSRQHSWNTQP
ncbi:hypothetical protein G7054_g2969 [Neopestalotiopsis clavispora]|nr:hypothetical protein G7054_g2969 [Neopestalotiopsis clavispora]